MPLLRDQGIYLIEIDRLGQVEVKARLEGAASRRAAPTPCGADQAFEKYDSLFPQRKARPYDYWMPGPRL
jgi:hypothetical protein